MKIKIRDKSTNLWLSDGGEFVRTKEQAKAFTSIVTAIKQAKTSGILDENLDVDWSL